MPISELTSPPRSCDVDVFPDLGGWRVREPARPERSTLHRDVTEARRAARELVGAHGGGRVVVRDLYNRLHVTHLGPRG